MAIALLTDSGGSVQAASGSGTTDAMDTTGANLLVFSSSGPGAAYCNGADSKSNTWTNLTTRPNNPGGTTTGIAYVIGSPTVGASHTFQGASTVFYNGTRAAAFSGADAYDQEAGSSDNASGTSHPSSSGAVTPSEDGCLIIYTICFGDGQDAGTVTPPTGATLLENVTSAGGHQPGAMAYEIQTTATARTPVWTTSNAVTSGAAMAVFTATAGGGGATVTGKYRSLLGAG